MGSERESWNRGAVAVQGEDVVWQYLDIQPPIAPSDQVIRSDSTSSPTPRLSQVISRLPIQRSLDFDSQGDAQGPTTSTFSQARDPTDSTTSPRLVRRRPEEEEEVTQHRPQSDSRPYNAPPSHERSLASRLLAAVRDHGAYKNGTTATITCPDPPVWLRQDRGQDARKLHRHPARPDSSDRPNVQGHIQDVDAHRATSDSNLLSGAGHVASQDDRLEDLLGPRSARLTDYIYREDGRLQDARVLVQSGTHAAAPCVALPGWTESDLLEAQKIVAQAVAQRTLACCIGTGSMAFSTRTPLLTEKWWVPGFNLSCVMKPSGNSVSAEKSVFTEDKVYWAFFHAGVASGLAIARDSRGVDSSWINYNRPVELSNRHAGFLLALGLNGHLRSLAKWVAFNYLTPKHTMTSVGLLLGLASSFIGTMDALVTRLLSVHIARMLPPGAVQLNLSAVAQTSGLFGLGLVYLGTQHRRTSEVMLSEIERPLHDTQIGALDAPQDESYRLAAGLALGFVNLGKGDQPAGMRDLMVLERLLKIAVNQGTIEQIQTSDKAIAAAVMAILLMFMKSNNQPLARKLEPPRSTLQLDFVRPDIFLLRALAHNLVMWDHIMPTMDWVRRGSSPPSGTWLSSLGTRPLNSRLIPRYATAAGTCFAMALRFAGTFDSSAVEVLLHHLDLFAGLARRPVKTFDERLTRNAISQCQDLIALCAAVVTAGSGDIRVLRRLRSLHGRTDPEITFGSHLAAHTAVGLLFLGGGTQTFSRRNLSIAALICALYPIFPTSILDNESHLQSLRHIWVLAAEPRCIIPSTLDHDEPVFAEVTVRLTNRRRMILRAPALMPELNTIRTFTIKAPNYEEVSHKQEQKSIEPHDTHSPLTPRLERKENIHNLNDSFRTQSLSAAATAPQTDPFEFLFHCDTVQRLTRPERVEALQATARSTALPSLDCSAADDALHLMSSLPASHHQSGLRYDRVLSELQSKVLTCL